MTILSWLRIMPVVAGLALTACEVGPDYHLPEGAKINDAGAQGYFASAEDSTDSFASVPAGWWRLYEDDTLNALQREALIANTDLRIAAANLARSQALQREAEGAHDVKGAADFTAERAQLSGQSYLLSEQLPSEYLGEGGIRVAYQLDLFGRLKRAAEAAGADREASAAGLELAEVTIAGDVARAYVEACAAGNERNVAERNLSLQQRTLAVIQQLIEAGRESATAATRAQAQVEQARAVIPQLRARQNVALFKLAVLTGTAALAAPLAFNSDGEFHDMVTSHLPQAAEAFQSVLVRAMAHAEAARWQDATPAQLAKEEASLRKEMKAAAGQEALRLKARLRALEEARRAPRH